MNLVLLTILITAGLYGFAVFGSFTHGGAPTWFSKEERDMSFTSISDLIRNKPPIFLETLRQAWLYFAVGCAIVAVGTYRSGHIEQYTLRSDPIQFWSYVGYWIALTLAGLSKWLHGSRKRSNQR